MLNLYVFYQFMSIERIVGSSQYLILIFGLAMIQSLLELIVSQSIQLTCSIGFSGILYGLIMWVIFSGKHPDRQMVIAILLTIFVSSITYPVLSLSGHLIGFVSGIIMATINLR